MQFLAKITPHGWANDGFNKLMLFGANAEDVVWPDGCLGCQQPGMGCTLLAEDGYRIQLDFDGTIYEYHSGRDTHFIYCENPISPIILRP